MPRPARRWRLGPLQLSRLASLSLLPAVSLAALGAWLRTADGAMHRPGLGVLLTILAMLTGVAGAVVKARASAILMVFSPRPVRVIAIASLIAGLVAMLLGCGIASVDDDTGAGWPAVFGESAIAGGLSLGLMGFLTIFWTVGMDYLGEQIEQRSDEEW